MVWLLSASRLAAVLVILLLSEPTRESMASDCEPAPNPSCDVCRTSTCDCVFCGDNFCCWCDGDLRFGNDCGYA